jgi:hypothetical protein
MAVLQTRPAISSPKADSQHHCFPRAAYLCKGPGSSPLFLAPRPNTAVSQFFPLPPHLMRGPGNTEADTGGPSTHFSFSFETFSSGGEMRTAPPQSHLGVGPARAGCRGECNGGRKTPPQTHRIGTAKTGRHARVRRRVNGLYCPSRRTGKCSQLGTIHS